MDPVTIGLIVQFALRYGPDAAEAIVSMFHQNTPPTKEQWAELWAKARAYNYEDYINAAGGRPPAPPPAGGGA